MAKLTKKDKKKKKFDYYDAFETQASIAVKEARLLNQIVSDFDSVDDVEACLERAHVLEREADEVCHSISDVLISDFVTPIDREDIMSIAQSLDEVIDRTEEIIQRFYTYDIHFMHEDARAFVKLIVRSCEALSEAMEDFRNCKKSDKFKALVYRVNELEDEADELYIKIIRDLYTKEREHPMRVMVWTRLFDIMEDCVDQCELVATKMNAVMVKYA